MKTLRSSKGYKVYYTVLLDWRTQTKIETKILSPKELSDFTKEIIPPPRQQENSWSTTKSLNWAELNGVIRNIKVGFYHSRLIFELDLKKVPENLHQFRQIRKKLKERVEKYLNKKVIPVMNKYVKNPRAFFYPIFEIGRGEVFWKNFGEQKPYSSATTCFYTKLDDPRGRELWLQVPLIGHIVSVLKPKKVKMRVSGPSIITTKMSNWFFWNLINIIFHEGLYRQSRPIGLPKGLFEDNGVYHGLENRLEDFANRLMDIFHDFSSAHVRSLMTKIALIIAIFGLLFTVIPYILPYITPYFLRLVNT